MVSCGCSVSNLFVLPPCGLSWVQLQCGCPPGALAAVCSYRWRCSEPWKLSEYRRRCWEADWVLPLCSFRKVFPGYFRSVVQNLTAVLTLARSWMLFFRPASWKQTAQNSLQLLFLWFPSVSWGPNPRRCPPVWDAVIQLCCCNDKMYVSAYLILHDSVSLFPLFSDQTPHLLRKVSFVRDYRKYSVIKTSSEAASHNPSACLQTQILTEAPVIYQTDFRCRFDESSTWSLSFLSLCVSLSFSVTLSISHSQPTSLSVCSVAWMASRSADGGTD